MKFVGMYRFHSVPLYVLFIFFILYLYSRFFCNCVFLQIVVYTTFKVMNGSVGIRGGEQWLGVQVRAQRSDSPPAGHVTPHPLWTAGRRDCCCLAAMTTNFESRMNGLSEEKEEARRFKSAPAVSEVHRVRGHSESKWLRRGAVRVPQNVDVDVM